MTSTTERPESQPVDQLDRPADTPGGLTGPADTADASVTLSSARPRPPAPEALAAGTIAASAVVPTPEVTERDDSDDRWETFSATGPSGQQLLMLRNLETGETRRAPHLDSKD